MENVSTHSLVPIGFDDLIRDDLENLIRSFNTKYEKFCGMFFFQIFNLLNGNVEIVRAIIEETNDETRFLLVYHLRFGRTSEEADAKRIISYQEDRKLDTSFLTLSNK